MPVDNLNRMLNPKTVALVGATDREGALGEAILVNLTRSGAQTVFCVNPRRNAVLGIPCSPSVAALPGPVDLVVIAVPPSFVPAVVEECGRAGAAGVVIITAERAEDGEAGKRLDEKVVAASAAHGIRVVGPASFGIIRPEIGLNASFLRADPGLGNIAFVSQSGQLGNAVLEWAVDAHIGFSMFASLGDMVDVDFGDVIDFLGNDYATRSILLDMERVVNARKFISSARGFARTKPIIVMKSGRSAEGGKGQAAGDDRVYSAAFKRVGVLRVREAEDLFSAVQVLDADHLPAGGRVAVICNAVTVGTMAADAILELGGSLARLSPGTVDALAPTLGAHWGGGNPIDLGGEADTGSYAEAIKTCAADSAVDVLLVICTTLTAAIPVEIAHTIAAAGGLTQKPVLAALMGGQSMRQGREYLREHKIPAYGTPEQAVRAYIEMFRYKRSLELLYETPVDLSPGGPQPKHYIDALIQKEVKGGATALTRERSMHILQQYGIPAEEGTTGAHADYELYLAMDRDREFGAFIRFGLAGIGRDIFGDCAIALPPLNQTLARRLIEESQAFTVLQGYRGRKPADLLKLEQLLIGFSNLVADFPQIASIEVEPLVVCDGEPRVLDARIFLDPAAVEAKGGYPHLVITPYPTRYVAYWRMSDGTEVLLRPVRPEDEPMEYRLFHSLSRATVRERFFSPLKEMSHEMLVRFCNIDYDREIAIAAEVTKGDERRFAGISRLIIEPGMKAQFAVIVHDDYQGSGLGYKLVDVLIGIAQEKGLDEVYGITLNENGRMIGLARKLGFSTRLMPDGVTGLMLKLK
jgi:acetyltransferase